MRSSARLLAPLLVASLACADEVARPTAPGTPHRPTAAVGPGGLVLTTVAVPPSMRSAPFNVARQLAVPPGFTVAVYARVSGARFMAVAPNGDLLVSRPGAGKVARVRPGGAGADPTVSDYLTGLRKPHDMVFHSSGGATWLYVAESHQVTRYAYDPATGAAAAPVVVAAGLPDASLPELRGSYGHELKNIAVGPDGRLYVSIASTCNACLSDTESTPTRGAVYVYDAPGGAGRRFARGLRNAEGLAFIPGTNTLWAVVNNRDNIAYPFHGDITGDGVDDYGKVVRAYVDNHPPEEFTRVRDGGNYGWPFCNPNPDSPSRYEAMPFDHDVQLNAGGLRLDCATADRIDQGIQAHSAPLGLAFLHGTRFPVAYQPGVAIALHGSWNRSTRTGYKVIYFPWDALAQTPTAAVDLVTGWLTGGPWGRPVDVAVNQAGSLLVSDDYSGTVYKLTSTEPVEHRHEAEQAQLYGMVTRQISGGYSGTGYVDFDRPSGAYVEWTVRAAAAGPRALSFHYALIGDDRPVRVSVNGTVIHPSLTFPSTGAWAAWNRLTIPAALVEGRNTVRVTSTGSDGPNVDYLAVQ